MVAMKSSHKHVHRTGHTEIIMFRQPHSVPCHAELVRAAGSSDSAPAPSGQPTQATMLLAPADKVRLRCDLAYLPEIKLRTVRRKMPASSAIKL